MVSPSWLFSFSLTAILTLIGGILHNHLWGIAIGLIATFVCSVIAFVAADRRDHELYPRRPGPDTKFTPPPSGI